MGNENTTKLHTLSYDSPYVVLCETALGKFYLHTNRGWAENKKLTTKQLRTHLQNAILKGEVWDADGNLPPQRTVLSIEVWKKNEDTNHLSPFTDFVHL